MDDKIKWVLVAVGAYFAYDWWTKNKDTVAGTTDAAAKAAAAAAAAAAAKAKATQTEQDKNTAAVTQQVADTTKADADKLAAAVKRFQFYSDAQLAGEAAKTGDPYAVAAANNRGMRYDHHTWNYFLAQVVGKPQPDPELWAPGKTMELVTVDRYRAMRMAAGMAEGMSGLSMAGMGWAPVLPWSTAWQA